MSEGTVSYGPVSVSALPTTLCVIRTQEHKRATLTVENPAGSGETLDVVVYRKPTPDSAPAPSEFFGWRSMPEGPLCNDLDVVGCYELELRATATGAGINNVTVKGALTP